MATLTESMSVKLGLNLANISNLADSLKKVAFGTFLEDASEMTVDTIELSGAAVGTLSKVPMSTILLEKSDGTVLYTQVPDGFTPGAAQFKVSNRLTREITGHSGLNSLTVKAYYFGITKSVVSGGGSYLKEALVKILGRM